MEKYDSTQDTMLHKARVKNLLNMFCELIKYRAIIHDESKLNNPEKECFDIITPKLKELTYGSDEYKSIMNEFRYAIDHHQKTNSHHPEFYENGISGFDLFDLVEMFFDWKAASERHADGNIYLSIEKNKTRFNISEQLCNILNNTAKKFNWER